MKFKEFIREYDKIIEEFRESLYEFFNDLGGIGPNARMSSRKRKGCQDYMKAEEDVKDKIGLIDSFLIDIPINCLAIHSLKNLEEKIEKGNNSEILEVIEKHEQLIGILKPYQNLRYSPMSEGPIYSKAYDKKYHELKDRFLKVA